ncbi:MAG TPA: DUF1003 domain-containing protein [Holophagaceae bacterium]|jgi:uncharacterized membrane protein|nr:DUF1003 domain-containing protein [Holophagaceae bacterium]
MPVIDPQLRAILERHPIEHATREHERRLNPVDRSALKIRDLTGSPRFWLAVAVFTIGWMAWNAMGPRHMRFDPFPGFILLLSVVKLTQLVFLPLLMIGQNLGDSHAQAQAEVVHQAMLRQTEEMDLLMKRLDDIESKLDEAMKGRTR